MTTRRTRTRTSYTSDSKFNKVWTSLATGNSKTDSRGRSEADIATGDARGPCASDESSIRRDRTECNSNVAGASSVVVHDDKETVGVSGDDAQLDISSAEALLDNLRRDLNVICDTGTTIGNGRVNRSAASLEPIARVLALVERCQSELLGDACIGIVKPLLRTLAGAETGMRVRERCSEVIIRILEREPDTAIEMQGYVIPTIVERLHRPDTDVGSDTVDTTTSGQRDIHKAYPLEQSEDVRSHLARIVLLIIRGSRKAVLAYVMDIVSIIGSLSLDQYHVNTVAACELAIALLAVAAANPHLKLLSKQLVYWLGPLMSAKRTEVRIAAIRAITLAVLSQGHESILDISAWRDPNMIPVKAFYGDDMKVNYFGKLSTDRNPRVRYAFLQMMREWLLKLPEAKNDHEYRLLPYVLSAVSDDTNVSVPVPVMSASTSVGSDSDDDDDSLAVAPDSPHHTSVVNIAEEALKTLAAIGRHYELENEEEMKRIRKFTPELMDPLCVDEQANSETAEGRRHTGSFSFPRPFTGIAGSGPDGQQEVLIGHGCRVCVFATFKRLQYPIVKELVSWQPDVCIGAAKLLRTCLILINDRVEESLQRILAAMVTAMTRYASSRDDSSSGGDDGGATWISEAGRVILDCAYLIGKHVSCPSIWMRLLLASLDVDATAETSLTLTYDFSSSGGSGDVPSILLILGQCLRGAAEADALVVSTPEEAHDLSQKLVVNEHVKCFADLVYSQRYCQGTLRKRVFCRSVEALLEVIMTKMGHSAYGCVAGADECRSGIAAADGTLPLELECKACWLALFWLSIEEGEGCVCGVGAAANVRRTLEKFASVCERSRSSPPQDAPSSTTTALLLRHRRSLLSAFDVHSSQSIERDADVLRLLIVHAFATSSLSCPDDEEAREADAVNAVDLVRDVYLMSAEMSRGASSLLLAIRGLAEGGCGQAGRVFRDFAFSDEMR